MKTYKIQSVGYTDADGNPQNAVVGQYVEKIERHSAQGEGDKYFFTIYFKDGMIRDVFNPTVVDAVPEEDNLPF